MKHYEKEFSLAVGQLHAVWVGTGSDPGSRNSHQGSPVFPSVVEVPAGQKIRLRIINQDPTPEEFESYELNREKVIAGNRETVVFIGPLTPGEYPFFGEFNPRTAQGKVVAQ